MRIELTLDDDMADFVEEQSRVQNKSVEQVVNETLRLGMTINAKPAGTHEFRVRPNRSGFVEGIDPTRLSHLDDDLEDEKFLAKDGP